MPFQTHYFSENLVTPGIESGTSGNVARNSHRQTTEAVITFIILFYCILVKSLLLKNKMFLH
jgi:hypothetical protein